MATVREELGDEGWLYSEQQQKLYRLKSDMARAHAWFVAIRTYSYAPPRVPEPMIRRRLLRHNAIEAWETIRRRTGGDARFQSGKSWIG